MADKPKTKKVPGLRVKSKTEGFRRGGRAWSVAETEVAASEFTKAQLEQIRNEPELLVTDCQIEVGDE